jgi:hypothetical protein
MLTKCRTGLTEKSLLFCLCNAESQNFVEQSNDPGLCDRYREQDLAFVREARADLFMGLRVFYNSSW